MCARAEQSRPLWSRRREIERERERCVRARWESKILRSRASTGDSQKLGLGAFLKGKRSLKGVCNVAKIGNTVHLHFSN